MSALPEHFSIAVPAAKVTAANVVAAAVDPNPGGSRTFGFAWISAGGVSKSHSVADGRCTTTRRALIESYLAQAPWATVRWGEDSYAQLLTALDATPWGPADG